MYAMETPIEKDLLTCLLLHVLSSERFELNGKMPVETLSNISLKISPMP
jgi:hypothetical protein